MTSHSSRMRRRRPRMRMERSAFPAVPSGHYSLRVSSVQAVPEGSVPPQQTARWADVPLAVGQRGRGRGRPDAERRASHSRAHRIGERAPGCFVRSFGAHSDARAVGWRTSCPCDRAAIRTEQRRLHDRRPLAGEILRAPRRITGRLDVEDGDVQRPRHLRDASRPSSERRGCGRHFYRQVDPSSRRGSAAPRPGGRGRDRDRISHRHRRMARLRTEPEAGEQLLDDQNWRVPRSAGCRRASTTWSHYLTTRRPSGGIPAVSGLWRASQRRSRFGTPSRKPRIFERVSHGDPLHARVAGDRLVDRGRGVRADAARRFPDNGRRSDHRSRPVGRSSGQAAPACPRTARWFRDVNRPRDRDERRRHVRRSKDSRRMNTRSRRQRTDTLPAAGARHGQAGRGARSCSAEERRAVSRCTCPGEASSRARSRTHRVNLCLAFGSTCCQTDSCRRQASGA